MLRPEDVVEGEDGARGKIVRGGSKNECDERLGKKVGDLN